MNIKILSVLSIVLAASACYGVYTNASLSQFRGDLREKEVSGCTKRVAWARRDCLSTRLQRSIALFSLPEARCSRPAIRHS